MIICHEVVQPDTSLRGKGITISYGYYSTPLGTVLLGINNGRLCYLGFLEWLSKDELFGRMKKHFPCADFISIDFANDDAKAGFDIKSILEGWSENFSGTLELELHGTQFQIAVWKELLKIPFGDTASYKDIAERLGRPKAVRAVGTANGNNPVSLIVPCHRVIQSSGEIGGYGWGVDLKKKLLGAEKATLLQIQNITHAV
jgi:AraC family transcriptional regulator of adaptative response/methylated-DNA-[protein]-cysteine methyltransferase